MKDKPGTVTKEEDDGTSLLTPEELRKPDHQWDVDYDQKFKGEVPL